MNLFNEMLKLTKNSAINMINNNLGNNAKDQKLRGQLHTCTYTDDAKFIIQKAVKQVFHVYPIFDTDILQFKQGNVQKRFIELKAILEIQVRGKMCKVDYNMMIPNAFPKKAPYVRIINRNPDFIVDDFYKSLQSPNDQKSYILNQRLNEIRTWDQSKSIVNVIIESYDLLRNKFPFTKPGGNKSQMNNSNMWGQNQSPWQQYNQPSNNGFYNNNQGYNNYVNGNNGGFGFNNMGGNWGNNNMGGNWGSNNMGGGNFQPPIPFNNNNITQVIANGQKFAGNSKKTLQKMKVQHTKALQTVQTLDILRYSIQSQEAFLRKQNVQMNNFLAANQNNQSSQSLANLIKPQDQLSEQILDLISSIKSRQDCTTQLQNKLNEGQITLDDFMKNVRRIQQTKFQEKVLLSKCVSVSQKY